MDSWNAVCGAVNLQKLERSEIFQGAQKRLKEERWYKPVLDCAEDSTNVNRVYLVSGTSFLFSTLLIVQYGTLLITGCIGFLYPGYKTLTVLEHAEIETGRRWLIYWFLYAALNFAEIFLFFLYWIPGYWVIKCVFLLWCYLPIKSNGADVVYTYFLHPYFRKNQEVIDDAISQIVKTAHSIYTDTEQNGGAEHEHEN